MADVIPFDGPDRAEKIKQGLIAQARKNYESIFPSEPRPADYTPSEYSAPEWDPA